MDKILGQGSENSIIEKTITATKKVIYRNRQNGGKYNIKEVKNVLSKQMKIEEYQASVIGNDTIFLIHGRKYTPGYFELSNSQKQICIVSRGLFEIIIPHLKIVSRDWLT